MEEDEHGDCLFAFWEGGGYSASGNTMMFRKLVPLLHETLISSLYFPQTGWKQMKKGNKVRKERTVANGKRREIRGKDKRKVGKEGMKDLQKRKEVSKLRDRRKEGQ